MEALLGWKDLSPLEGSDTNKFDAEVVNKALANGEDIVMPLLHYRSNGNKFWDRIESYCVHSKSHVPLLCVCLLLEISEQEAINLKSR